MDDHLLARAPRSPASPGRNVLALQVLCWGAAAYLEDQDMLLGSPKIEGLGLPSRLPMLRLGCRKCGAASGKCEHRELKQVLHNKEAELPDTLVESLRMLSQICSLRAQAAGGGLLASHATCMPTPALASVYGTSLSALEQTGSWK